MNMTRFQIQLLVAIRLDVDAVMHTVNLCGAIVRMKQLKLGTGGLTMRTRKKTKRCIYSDSCFKCPLSDCRMNTPAQLNCLPLDFEPDTKKFKVVKAHE